MSLQLPRPPVHPGKQTAQYPSKVTVDAQAVLKILSHALRKNQERIVGTLVGVRSDDGNTVEIKSAYIVPTSEVNDQIKINVDYHAEMFQLVRKAHPDYAIVGWYSTSAQINNLSGLIHDLYSQEQGTYPYPAIHLTMQTSTPEDINLQTYITSTIGTGEAMGSHIFTPIANEVSFTNVDKSALQLVNQAAREGTRVADVFSVADSIDITIDEMTANVEAVRKYVAGVLGGKQGNPEVAKYLYRTLSTSAVSSSNVSQTYLDDLKAISKLGDAVRQQVQTTDELTALV